MYLFPPFKDTPLERKRTRVARRGTINSGPQLERRSAPGIFFVDSATHFSFDFLFFVAMHRLLIHNRFDNYQGYYFIIIKNKREGGMKRHPLLLLLRWRLQHQQQQQRSSVSQVFPSPFLVENSAVEPSNFFESRIRSVDSKPHFQNLWIESTRRGSKFRIFGPKFEIRFGFRSRFDSTGRESRPGWPLGRQKKNREEVCR